MSVHDHTYELQPVDRRLLERLSTALVDPALHTEVRAQLRTEIRNLLRIAASDIHDPEAVSEHRERVLAADGHELSTILEDVLVDPNLHTDMRARIYRRMTELIDEAEGTAL